MCQKSQICTDLRLHDSPGSWVMSGLVFWGNLFHLKMLSSITIQHIYIQHFIPTISFVCLFVCLGLTSLWNIWGHITTVPACSSGTLTNVLPHRNAMPQTQDTTPHPVTVYRHGANLSLCYPFMWNVTLEYTATHFNVLGETWPGNPSPTFHTHQRTFNLMLSWWSTVGSSVESTVPTGSWTRDLWCANPVRYPLAHSDFLQPFHINRDGWYSFKSVLAKTAVYLHWYSLCKH